MTPDPVPRPEGPVYLRLYERLRREIVGGSYPFGSRMPSKRQLAEEEGVSVITAEHAYALLCDEGYLEARERSGYYVSFRDTDGFVPAPGVCPLPRREESRPAPSTDLPISALGRIMRRVIAEQGASLLERCPNRGREELREAISRYLARSRGIHAAPEHIWIGAGAEYLYGLIVQALGPDRIYAAEDPSFEKIAQVYRAHGAECVLLPLDRDGIRSASLAETKASVLHITPYRSYPSDVTASPAKRREYVRWAAREDRFVVEDDYASEFTPASKPAETVFSLARRGNVIYMNTFSRTIAPSLRIGYLVLSEEMLSLFSERVGFYACPVPVLEQLFLAEYIESGEFERSIRRTRRQLRRE